MNFVATIDTNVLISAFINHNSYPGKIIDMIFTGIITPVINQDILFEYIDVLTRDKFNFNKTYISKMINGLISNCIFAERTKTNEFFIDEDDIVFYEITMTQRKTNNAYLVTGNKKHYPVKPFVVNPKEMYDIVKKANSNEN